MFEKWFGVNNKKENKPSVDGVAHIDGSFEDSRLPKDLQGVQDKINFIDDNNKKKNLGERWDIEDRRDVGTSSKVVNERRKEKLGERNSGLGDENLVDEPEILTKEDKDEKHLNALAEIYDEGDDFKEEHREAA